MNRSVINHEINMLYRQLGKKVYDDSKDEKTSSKDYEKLIKKINKKIEMIQSLDIVMGGIDIEEEALEGVQEEEREPMMSDDGILIYKFCSSCHAGNHPKATKCIRCHETM